MAKLKRDERLCPFCAETIKAAAIRCRFCQADLTPVEAELEEVEVEPVVEPVETTLEPVDGSTRSRVDRLTAILATLAVLAAGAFGVVWWRAEHGSADSAPDGTLVGEEPRSQAIVAGADLTQRALSYDYRTLANDMEVARPRMTASFRKEYDQTMAQVKANTLKNKIVLQADVVASSIITSTERKAQLLVFINQTTTAGATAAEQLDRNSLVVTLVRGKGDWMLSEVTALG